MITFTSVRIHFSDNSLYYTSLPLGGVFLKCLHSYCFLFLCNTMQEWERGQSSCFGCVSAGWSLDVTVLLISNADKVLAPGSGVYRCERFLPLIRPAGSCQVTSRCWCTRGRYGECGQIGTLYCYFPQISPRPHNQNKSTTRAFTAAMTSHKPAPSPQVNRKHWGKRPCQSPYVCLVYWICYERWKRMLTWCFPCVFSKLGRFGGPADSRWSDEGRGGSEVTWQTVHVIIVILVALRWDGLGSRWSPTPRPLTLTQAAPNRHHCLTDPETGASLTAGSGGRRKVRGPSSSSAPTLLPTKNKTATKTITAVVKRLDWCLCGL